MEKELLTELAALQLHIEYGNYTGHDDDVFDNVERLIPAKCLMMEGVDHEEKEKEYGDMIIPKYKKYYGTKRIEAQKMYLKLLKDNPFYGSI
jgi:hypothetical protein